IIVRARPHIKQLAGHPHYERRLNVTWRYGDDGKTGMPSPELNLEMHSFELRLFEALEDQNHAIAVAVVTHAGSREWIFYSLDVNESVRRINDAFAQEPQRPLELEAVDDPNWAEYTGILANFGGETSEA